MPESGSIAPIALQKDQGEALWFLGFLVTIKASRATTGGRVSVIEHLGPQGAGSPLHIHHNEDEWFYVLEGELTVWIAGKLHHAPAGSFVFGPRGIPHTFQIASPQARFLLVAEPAGIDEFIRELSQPAATLSIPPATAPLPDPARLMAAAQKYGLEIVGPPGIPS